MFLWRGQRKELPKVEIPEETIEDFVKIGKELIIADPIECSLLPKSIPWE